MGQCMSRKAAGAFAASAAAAHTKPAHKMHKHAHIQSPGGDEEDPKELPKKSNIYSKGVATSFGFKRRAAPSIASNSNAARRLANTTDIIDRNGNGNSIVPDTESLTSNQAPTGRSTPRLMPPKKEANATRVNRFGFRQPQINRLHKVSDLNNPPSIGELCNNNVTKLKSNSTKIKSFTSMDNNRNRMNTITMNPPQVEKVMLQTTQLPRPEPIRVVETKTAKTLANTSKRNAYHEDHSPKDGSLTEDSGVGSQNGSGSGEQETLPVVERLTHSPSYGARRNFYKSRNLEIVRSGSNGFDVRDLEDSSELCAPLPQLPSAFTNTTENFRGIYNSGFVREKAKEYQRFLDSDNRRKISVTSSEGFSDDYCDEEKKPSRDQYNCEKTFMKPSAHRIFLKLKSDDSSPASSDEHDWVHGGEAMADEVSFSISSSDESKDREQLTVSIPTPNKLDLTIEDHKFAAIAASNNILLEDETSPVDSLISYSESDEILRKKINRSSSNSKDINEKATPSSPGTPTNASNSLSLSDGKDDFLIDDEIADQPALVFEDNLVGGGNETTFSISQNSESTGTMVESTPKPKRRSFLGFEGSPLSLRKRKVFHSRAGSLDTLSPCESIASDDLMMDYDYSQSSGLDEMGGGSEVHGFLSLDDTILRKPEQDGDDNINKGDLRDWSTLLGNYTVDKCVKSNASKSRLLWSRTGTPNSIPDSPKSLDSKSTTRSHRHSVTSSPLRLRGVALSSNGYDSDDSIRLDRANHSAMKQDIMSIKTMLLKLRRVLNEQPDEDILLRSETHIPFDGQLTLTNGLFNGLCSSDGDDIQSDEANNSKLEMTELRKQILFLQGQLEDKEKTVQDLQEQMIKLTNENYNSNSAPTSAVLNEFSTCNAATQTERIRPISASPSLLNGSPTDGNIGSLVSASESSQHKSRPSQEFSKKSSSTKLWRKPGEPPPQRYSSIPRRAHSRTRTPSNLNQ